MVTANYDGNKKYRTTIGDRAFIGCNTNLVPPVTVGEGAYTAAGTTIDEDVPAGALAIGRVHQQIKEKFRPPFQRWRFPKAAPLAALRKGRNT